MKYAVKGNKPSSLFFGRGLYSTSASSSAVRYAKVGYKITGAVFVVRVACGNAEVLKGADLTHTNLEDQDGPPPGGYHSRIVNDPHSAQSYKKLQASHGAPLLPCDDEIVVFDEAAMIPRYIILFRK